MNNSQPIKRSAPSAKKETGGVKVLIMLRSLAGTLAGWGILAAGQVHANSAPAAVVQPPSAASQVSVLGTNPQPTLRQVAPPVVQARPLARSRSSR
jgi:hypothetical protein